jgi:hypothetical protein
VRYDLALSYRTEVEATVVVEGDGGDGASRNLYVWLIGGGGSVGGYRLNGLAGSVANGVVTTGLAAESGETQGSHGGDGEKLLNHSRRF